MTAHRWPVLRTAGRASIGVRWPRDVMRDDTMFFHFFSDNAKLTEPRFSFCQYLAFAGAGLLELPLQTLEQFQEDRVGEQRLAFALIKAYVTPKTMVTWSGYPSRANRFGLGRGSMAKAGNGCSPACSGRLEFPRRLPPSAGRQAVPTRSRTSNSTPADACGGRCRPPCPTSLPNSNRRTVAAVQNRRRGSTTSSRGQADCRNGMSACAPCWRARIEEDLRGSAVWPPVDTRN